MEGMDIDTILIAWVRNFLTGRKQRVKNLLMEMRWKCGDDSTFTETLTEINHLHYKLLWIVLTSGEKNQYAFEHYEM